MVSLGMMYSVRGGLVLGQMRGCYLKSGVYTPLEGGGRYNILHLVFDCDCPITPNDLYYDHKMVVGVWFGIVLSCNYSRLCNAFVGFCLR